MMHLSYRKEICPDGMRKKSGSLYCDDIDECVEGTHLCDQYQNCLNTNGSYECHCKLGFELDTITGACADVNECATGEHNCISQAQRCDNTVGSYLCIRITSCGTGYVLHHSTGKCEDIDECALNIHNCGSDYTCQNIRGSFRCLRKRTTTTSTTPDYEYYYDDSEEDNSTSTADNQPKEPTTTTTETPIPQPQSPPTSSTTEKTENNEVEPPFISKHKAAQDWKRETTPRNDIKLSVLPSLCEDYAPNELCAHHCIPVPGSYRCECNPGFMLMADGRNCKEVSKNRCKPRNPCHHKCNDNGVEVKCSCRRGYELMADGKSCQDIDECQLEDPVCLPGTQCHNLHGSYKCIPFKKEVEKGQCPPGFARNLNNNVCDGYYGDDMAETIQLCCHEGAGFAKNHTLSDCRGTLTTPPEVPPAFETMCQIAKAQCCNQYFQRGYELMADGKSCQDIDECQLEDPVCLPGTQCHNLHGSYKCIPFKKEVEKGQCPPGFARNLNNNVCDDINECLLPNPPCPSFVCENTIGGYSCGGVTGNPINLSTSPRTHVEDRCPPGFKVGLHGECEDVDECAVNKHDCNLLSQFCINTHSSFYCQDKVSKHCPPGFKIDSNTNKCGGKDV
ncbi:hypothetical protein B5X24_HaOG205999 [Helicoverpa armigera]|uniref:EGF-like domain-containing protein n=1 Tax=Helicoverpa armigera TaxID=29058 RepID=A0A2W1B3W4_HELAM|nr:hypothetical protein B5X24_HaOG205999 [Helicoverpa armigera]